MKKLTAALALTMVGAGCTSEREPVPQPMPSAIETFVPSPSTATTERGIDIQPLLDAEAQLKPIEPARLASFINTIKQKGEVLDWSKGSRYRVVVTDDGVVFTAELDFGSTPPTTPQEVVAAKPEFIQIYVRFPGEKRAQHAFIDGSIPGEGGEAESLRPDGRVNELFGFDSQALLNNRAALIQQSGTAAQELYTAAVDAVLNQ